MKKYKPVNGNPTGGFIYTNHQVLTGCNKEKKNKMVELWTNTKRFI